MESIEKLQAKGAALDLAGRETTVQEAVQLTLLDTLNGYRCGGASR